ncbi:mannose-1-phosphate guanylyltransferase/mannose-6-phosphate isomerase [Asticcacaulis sp. EMRT-3]|uniref:mannose-1-phosphate guanylyltransferase/mannose-6-phosphate isomerase n=1 Tax=Asticcacaulis sp. EMRT-3 TaxID=3040349 RepID=UPI0024AF99B7|nr:mannose-1-phosphate guanylyltransferase/mannose-6-phosphate isomerase [Asticcacaulis sp. EMRT-3]MDI7776371.1 mannose-1-phosphate guanylyltransferase/mannose-6-phosphate isomerase [Asticcacaulis sp. EMRT-3]
MSFKIIPVIMSGGSGTRLWPLSTPEAPKQFHALATSNSMIQETALRLTGEGFLPPVAICGRGHLDLVTRQLDQIGLLPSSVVLEPFARNTAAVAAIAALSGQATDPDALVLLVPADHVIIQPDAFVAALERAAETAKTRIVTFGIKAAHPETGFGYIEHGAPLSEGVFEIKRFCEKPDLDTATSYVAGGQHDWNAGIFLFSPAIMLAELEKHAPEVLAAARESFEKAQRNGVVIRLDEEAFARVPSISVDYAVMEKTKASAVVPCDIGWADVGGFAELWRLGEKDASANHVKGDAILIEAENCLIHNSGPVVAVIGLSDIMVISTPSGILVAPISRAQDVKKAAEAAKARLEKG